jgi:hypothetical protein
VAEAQAIRVDVNDRLDEAEVPVVIAFERVAGRLDVLAAVDGGEDRLERALASAREHGLLYDELLCLRAVLVAAGSEPDDAGGFLPERIERARADHDALVERLGVVRT